MCELSSVFEVRSGMCGAPGEGDSEGGMFSSFEQAKERANEVIEKASEYDNIQWISDYRAVGRFYWVEINEHDVIYPEQE
ncbi:hypothetical protein CUZ11_004112 [Salmonella enterica subsp. enterica serovar 4,[5],12:i:-]|nr:hypothetical protein [Salmonella enterica subsp. enterica serovar 4,[5],12:i:-]